MKKLVYSLCILLTIISCEKSGDQNKYSMVDFEHKILDDFYVTSIAFDNQGTAWIGTFKQGLIKYNPEETIVYNSANSIIPDNSRINDIAVDSEDNIWIGCGGLIKYDGIQFTSFNSSNSEIPEDNVWSVEVDSDDNIWFTSCRFQEGGVVKYDGNNWTVYTPDNSDLPVNLVQSIAIDGNDNVWLALSETVMNPYLVKISNEVWTIYGKEDMQFSGYPIDNSVYYFMNIDVNSINEVFGSINYMFSSDNYPNINRPQFIKFNEVSTETYFFNNSLYSIVKIDNQDNIWCGGSNGILGVYDGFEWHINQSSFVDLGLCAIEQANDGKIWVGTPGGIYINE